MKQPINFVIGIAIVLLIFWGCNKNNMANKYEALYNKNQFVIDQLLENKQVNSRDVKNAVSKYDELSTEILHDDSPGGQGY